MYTQLIEFCEGSLDDCHLINGIKNIFKDLPKIVIYPNPSRDKISISVQNEIDYIEIIKLIE